MKRRDLEKKISSRARAQGVEWILARSTGNHDVFTLDGQIIPIPRHNEIAEGTAEAALKLTETKLGKGWWR